MIEIKNLSKKYGDHYAIRDLNMSVEPGKIYGFLGPNGAGKSTTMNIMTGYLGATGGEVIVDGHDILKEPEQAKKCFGYLPEIPPLYDSMTVKEYLQFVAELKKIAKKQRKEAVDEVLETICLVDVKDRLIRNLSKGYRQRVGLAQAVIGSPDIIILDEPMVGLDPKQIMEMREYMKGLAQNHTVILSSHILTEISAICDYIFILSEGKLVASDTTQALLEKMSKDKEQEIVLKGDVDEARKLLEEHGFEVLETRTAGTTLEEVFLQLTQEGEKEC